MKLPVHETETGWVVAYTSQWADVTYGPMPGHSWLTIEQAKSRFLAGESLEVVEAHDHDDEKLLRCRWVVGMTHPGWARVQFFNAGQSIIASIDYKLMENGQLFVSGRADYVYPDQERHYSESDAVTIYSAYYKPDGTGVFDVRDAATRQSMVTRFKDADFSSLWFDWSEFGNWDVFANPDNGTLPDGFAMTPL